jgi:predicted metal-dependent hydrolase
MRIPFFSRPGPKSERLIVACGDGTHEIEVRRHPAARRYSLRVRETSRDVVLTMPTRGSFRQARAFAEKHAGWIAARLKRLPPTIAFAQGNTIPLRGVEHRIVHRPAARGSVWCEVGADGEPLLCVAGDAPHVARRVADFLKREARRELAVACRRHAAALGVRIVAVSVRDTRSRWGSCSATGTLSFSWRLVLAPAYVLDYLAAHEVAHCVELNHSDRFWRAGDRLTPERKRAEAWLRFHGNELHRFGPRRSSAAAEQFVDQPVVEETPA